jgi:TonB family protein
MLSILVLVLAAQSVAPHSSVCTKALASGVGAAVSEICLAEEEARRGNAADKDSPERRQRFEAAAQHYRKGANLASNHEVKTLALDALATVSATQLQAFDEAELALRELIALTPDDLKPVFRLARLQEDRGWIDIAEATLVEARRRHPEDVEPYKALAQFYARRVSALSVQTARATPPSPPAERDEQGIVRVGGPMAPPRRVGNPVYPPEAKAAGIEGVVIAEIVVNEQGGVTEAKVIRSIPLLDEAALAAVRTWQYEPTLLNGQPVPVRMTVTVNFSTR